MTGALNNLSNLNLHMENFARNLELVMEDKL